MILSDRDLRARLLDGSIGIDPLSDLEQQLQPASIDLRLGARFRSIAEVDSEAMVTVAEGDAFVLAPGAFALGTTIERVRVPNDLVARVEGRSSIGRHPPYHRV
jgi:dCTP deaminase